MPIPIPSLAICPPRLLGNLEIRKALSGNAEAGTALAVDDTGASCRLRWGPSRGSLSEEDGAGRVEDEYDALGAMVGAQTPRALALVIGSGASWSKISWMEGQPLATLRRSKLFSAF